MKTRERQDIRPKPETPPAAPSADASLNALAQQGATFAATANEIITTALSGDSVAFLASNQQVSGE